MLLKKYRKNIIKWKVGINNILRIVAPEIPRILNRLRFKNLEQDIHASTTSNRVQLPGSWCILT